MAAQGVEIIASLPCYLENNVNSQRGEGVYGISVQALKRLNALGYGLEGSALRLDLVYNPLGPQLPPSQCALEADYKRELRERHGVEFNRLYTLANMPIERFGSTLVSKGQFEAYMQLLRSAHRPENLSAVMCRDLISVDYRGYVYDCDFNQLLGLPLRLGTSPRIHLKNLLPEMLEGNPVEIADHCFGCTAGQGSSCGGALS
jgi:radical SAM/Cys-rich protein